MTVTAMDPPEVSEEMTGDQQTHAQRKQALAGFIGYLDTMPDGLGLTVSDFAPVASKMLDQPVDPIDLAEVYGLTCVRNLYLGPEDPLRNLDQSRLDAAIDHLLDVSRCEACNDIIGRDSIRTVCGDSDGAEFCTWQCHMSWHVGGHCDAGSDR